MLNPPPSFCSGIERERDTGRALSVQAPFYCVCCLLERPLSGGAQLLGKLGIGREKAAQHPAQGLPLPVILCPPALLPVVCVGGTGRVFSCNSRKYFRPLGGCHFLIVGRDNAVNQFFRF